MRLIFEALLLVIILFCIWNGYKKGLILCIGTILSIIISLYVGDLLGDTFSPAVKPVLRPFVSGYMDGSEGVISKNLNELLGTTSLTLSFEEAVEQNPEIRHQLASGSFQDIGVYTSAADKMADEALELTDHGGYALSSAIVEVTCREVGYVAIFVLFFLLSVIIITVIGNLFNLRFSIPGQENLNVIGGAVMGGITGILICMIIVWTLRFMGLLLPEEEMRRTLFTALFLKLNPIPLFLSI